MNTKSDTNRHVLTIQAKKKRHKAAKKKAKQQAAAAAAAAAAGQQSPDDEMSSVPAAVANDNQQQQQQYSLSKKNSSSTETIEDRGDRLLDEVEAGYSDDDERENEQETWEEYCRGRYHQVKLGDLFLQRYHVIRK